MTAVNYKCRYYIYEGAEVAGQRAKADDSALQEKVRRLIVDEGRSQRGAALILKCDRSTIKRVATALGIADTRLNEQAKRQAEVMDLATTQASITGIADATGLSRAGVRKIKARESGSRQQFGRKLTLREQSILALAALQEHYPNGRWHDVADDREGGTNVRSGGRFRLTQPLDNGPPPGRVLPQAANDDDINIVLSDARPDALAAAEKRAEELALAKVVKLHERDGLSAKQIAHLLGLAGTAVQEEIDTHLLLQAA